MKKQFRIIVLKYRKYRSELYLKSIKKVLNFRTFILKDIAKPCTYVKEYKKVLIFRTFILNARVKSLKVR